MNSSTKRDNVNLKLNLKLKGMSCAACANSIEQAISAVSGVSSSIVNFGTEQAAIEYNSHYTNIEAIQDAIAKAGYSSSALSKQGIFTGENDLETKARKAESNDLKLPESVQIQYCHGDRVK